MRKAFATLYLLGTIVLFASASSKQAQQPQLDGPQPPCLPCAATLSAR